MLAINGGEQLGVLGQGFRCAEKQITARPQRIMKYRQQLLLQLLVEIDQQIAARDQVDPRERRIADHAVRGEDAQVAHLLAERIADAVAAEKAVDPLWADILQHRRRIACRPGNGDRRVVDIGREHDDLRSHFQQRHPL